MVDKIITLASYLSPVYIKPFLRLTFDYFSNRQSYNSIDKINYSIKEDTTNYLKHIVLLLFENVIQASEDKSNIVNEQEA